MLLSFSIALFLINIEVTNKKHQIDPIYSNVQKQLFLAQIKSMETTICIRLVWKNINFMFQFKKSFIDGSRAVVV